MFFQKRIWLFALLLLFCAAQLVSAYEFQYADAAKSRILRWKNNQIPVSISNSIFLPHPGIRPGSDVSGAVLRSLASWKQVANVEFQTRLTELQSISPPGKSGDAISLISISQTPENLLLFSGDYSDVSARTRVFYDRKGFITEADIILNPYLQFSTDGSFGTFDLESTLTHEIGHLLGLDHSNIPGSTMYPIIGKNGIYGLPAVSARTLANDDIVGIRSIYGSSEIDPACCGILKGKIVYPNGKGADEFNVWIESATDGRTIAGVSTNHEGDFSFDGIVEGRYSVFAKSLTRKEGRAYFEELGTVQIEIGKSSLIFRKLPKETSVDDVQFIGLSGQLSRSPIVVNPGNSYFVYLGGQISDSEMLQVFTNSPHIVVDMNSLVRHEFGKELSAVSFEIRVREATPLGEYSFHFSDKSFGMRGAIGGLTVEPFLNSLSSRLIEGFD